MPVSPERFYKRVTWTLFFIGLAIVAIIPLTSRTETGSTPPKSREIMSSWHEARDTAPRDEEWEKQPKPSFAISPDQLTFTYSTYDLSTRLKCRHRLENPASQDWGVQCYDDEGKVRRQYGVHLWLSEYRRNSIPEVRFELLYWVTDRKSPAESRHTGTTVWFHLTQMTSLYGIQVKQSVENDMAGLYLEIRP